MQDLEFHQVETPEHRDQAATLIREYLDWLNDRLRRDHGIEFDAEAMVRSDISDRDKFHPPNGRFYVVRLDRETAGVGCLKRQGPEDGELQRMYVLPAFRGRGLGRALAVRLIEDARAMGLRRLRLESLGFLHAAHALYRSLGFTEIPPYTDNSMEAYQAADQLGRYNEITVFMELDLQRGA